MDIIVQESGKDPVTVSKPREEMSLEEVAQETGGALLPQSQTIRHDHY